MITNFYMDFLNPNSRIGIIARSFFIHCPYWYNPPTVFIHDTLLDKKTLVSDLILIV